MYVNKFLTFSVSTLLELAGGVTYCFSVYSPALKHSLGYTQTQIQGVANPFLPNIIAGWVPGLVHDALQKHNRFGPRFVLLIGSVIHGVGYFGLWLVGTHRLVLPYWMVVAIGVVAFNGTTWIDTASISANVRNFPHDRGSSIGILKAMMGLSGSVFTTIYVACFRPHAITFLLFIAAVPVVLSVVAFPIFNAVPFRQQSEIGRPGAFCNNGTRFSVAYMSIVAMGFLMLVFAGLDTTYLTPGLRAGMVTGIVIVLCPLLFLSLNSGGYYAHPAIIYPSTCGGDEETGTEARGSTALGHAAAGPSSQTEAQSTGKCTLPHDSCGDSLAGSLLIQAARAGTDRQQTWGSSEKAGDSTQPTASPSRMESAQRGLPINRGNLEFAPESAAQSSSCMSMAHSVAPKDGGVRFGSTDERWQFPSEQRNRADGSGCERAYEAPRGSMSGRNEAPQKEAGKEAPFRRASLRESLRGSLRGSLGQTAPPPQLKEVLLDSDEQELEKQSAPRRAETTSAPSAPTRESCTHPRRVSEDSSRSRSTQGSSEPSERQWPLELSLRASFGSLDFWLLFTIFGLGTANGLLFLNNAGQIVQALQGPQDGQDSLLTLFSVLNAFGRLACGYFPEQALHLFGTPRPVFMTAVAGVCAAISFVTAFADYGMLWVMAPVSGFVYGCHWSLMPAMASEFFGLGHFGLLYCVLQSSVTMCTFAISNMLGGYLYQARVKEHGDILNTCIGADCFRTAFLIAGLLEMLAVGASVWLLARTQYIYAQEHRDIVREEQTVDRCSRTGHRIRKSRAQAAIL